MGPGTKPTGKPARKSETIGGLPWVSKAAEPSKRSRKLIGQLLVEAGVITEAHLEEALQAQMERGGKIVETLVGLGALSPEDFVTFLAKQAGVASFNLSNYDCPAGLIKLVPRDLAVEHEIFPIDRMGPLLTVGMVCPLDIQTIHALEEITGLRVKPILCTPRDIRKAIERYYSSVDDSTAPGAARAAAGHDGLEAPIRLSQVVQTLRLLDKLPALPETVERLRAVMSDTEPRIADIALIVGLDPPIAAKVLGLANSAAYGLPNHVDNLKMAITMLGMQETYSLVLSCAVIDTFEKTKHLDYRAFWLDSMCCAAAARMIAQATGNERRFGVSAAGLMHDLGRAALAKVAPQLYGRVDQTLPIRQVLEEEQRVIGLTHAEAGFHLACQWGLPPDIAEPIRFHHTPALAVEARENVAIIALAAAMAHSAETFPAEIEGLEPALDILHLEAANALALWEQFQGVTTGAGSTLSVL
ncbi:MAG: HDOD domain-containing protein [Candidatus Hydrogenedentes bacterium]|nr:HDOD domain-containing protein [Candidatus Hydrogenedentota bacterium]